METERFIEPLLRKYQQAPGFPFDQWASDAVSFYALMNLWDDLFKAAAGKLAGAFVATLDIRMDPESPIYDVTALTLGRRVIVVPERDGGTFHFIARPGEDGAPFRSELCFATDIAAPRLAAAVDIIRAYMTTPAHTKVELAALEADCVAGFAHRFGFPDYDPFANRRA